MLLVDLIGAWPGAAWVRANWIAYLFVNAAHILSIGLLVGSILPLDLKLLGAFRLAPIAAIAPFLVRVGAFGAVAAIGTGFWLFSVKPAEYIENTALLAKIALLASALINAALQHAQPNFHAAASGAAPVALRTRLHAGLSLILWLCVLLAGRWIGFL